jgi:hypothetical protein
MLDKEKAVQGVGIYAEFRKVGQTLQMFITPDAYTTSGRLAPMTLWRRVVTPITPKKQWSGSKLSHREVKIEDLVENKQTIADDQKEMFVDNRMRHATSLFDSLLNQGWALEKKPIAIEISRFDADEIIQNKTPNKALYRVKISRTALGFPAEIV